MNRKPTKLIIKEYYGGYELCVYLEIIGIILITLIIISIFYCGLFGYLYYKRLIVPIDYEPEGQNIPLPNEEIKIVKN